MRGIECCVDSSVSALGERHGSRPVSAGPGELGNSGLLTISGLRATTRLPAAQMHTAPNRWTPRRRPPGRGPSQCRWGKPLPPPALVGGCPGHSVSWPQSHVGTSYVVGNHPDDSTKWTGRLRASPYGIHRSPAAWGCMGSAVQTFLCSAFHVAACACGDDVRIVDPAWEVESSLS